MFKSLQESFMTFWTAFFIFIARLVENYLEQLIIYT